MSSETNEGGDIPLPHVFIATPCYDGSVSAHYLQSILDTIEGLNKAGIQATVQTVCGNCYVAEARNQLVKYFLNSKATDLFFLDADMGWTVEGFVKVLMRPFEIVGGVYPKKSETEEYPVIVRTDVNGYPLVHYDTGCISVTGLPTGFLRIKRSAIERMIECFPHKKYQDRKLGECWNLFECEQEGDTWWGEDFTFCRRWESIGGLMWAEPNIDFRHVGSKTWTGNYHNFLLAQPRHE